MVITRPVHTKNSIGIVKIACDPVGDASSITLSRVELRRASTVSRESENGRTCAPHPVGEVGQGSGELGSTFVAVVQAADLWNDNHTSRGQRRHRTRQWCILVQPEVRSRSRVVGDVLFQNAPKAGSRQHDDVIEVLSSDRSDESFDIGVLPWDARRRQDFLDADGFHVIECKAGAEGETSSCRPARQR